MIEGRALFEAALLPALYPILRNTPQGDGHPVLLVPGFTAGDATLVGLSAFLRSRGYHVETWGLGQNTGFKLKFSHALEQKLRFMHHRHQRKVSLVGWSLGGVYAFYTAHAAPGVRPQRGVARQPDAVLGQRVRRAAAGQGDLPLPRPPDGPGRAPLERPRQGAACAAAGARRPACSR